MKKKQTRAPKRFRVQSIPRTPKEITFCEEYLKHFDGERALKRAGIKNTARRRVAELLERFADYLRPKIQAKSRLVAQTLVLSQEEVLRAMSRKAVFNPLDFIERATTPLMRERFGRAGESLGMEVVEWNGTPVYGERFKPFSDLTPEQAQTVQVVSDEGGTLRYRLPTISEQHQHLTSVGKQLGIFLEKIILEKHEHEHRHAHLHLDQVTTERLQSLTQDLLPLVGAEFAQRLGFAPASPELKGVLMPEKPLGG